MRSPVNILQKQISEIHLAKLTNFLQQHPRDATEKKRPSRFEAARVSVGSVMPTKSLELTHTIKLIQELTSD